ncbi:MAG: FecR domain-containing protein [Lentisphaerales bacterium]|nr:FecR domain-containing protein [Lentisphaerales bacterium]
MTNEELFNRYLNKDLDQQSQDKLKSVLATPAGRQEFFQFMSGSAEIGQYLKLDEKCSEEDLIFSDLVKRSEKNLLEGLQGNLGSDERSVQRHSSLRPKHLLYMSVLALASMLVLAVFMHGKAEKVNPPSVLINSVARVILLEGDANVKLGDWLNPGDVTLYSGEMELAFDSGARVLLQGQVDFRLETAQRAFLYEGKLTAYVPPEAKGFIINTHEGTIVDLGTEFAVNVDRDQRVDVHVLEGEVEASLLEGSAVKLLTKNQSVRIAEGGFRESLIPVTSFERLRSQDTTLKTAYIYWPFESEENGILKDQGNSGFGDFYNLELQNQSIALQPGKFGNALKLNGKRQYLTSKFKGIGGTDPRTISFWLKIPPNLKDGEHYAIIAWGRVAPTQKWQLGINFQRSTGVRGAIRTEFSKGYVVGTTDLRDGRWHHITSVFIGGDNADVAPHVRHYVDGRLEGVSGYQPIKINTATTAPDSQPAFIGKYINRNGWYFRGAIDEMYIFESALTPAQIVMLRDRQLEAE